MSELDERFAGVSRLLGAAALERLRQAHACVVGLGGVGSWVVEALARSGIGRLTLIDGDVVCLTNTNRQLPALATTIGLSKAAVLAERVQAINPQAVVNPMQVFVSEVNLDEILSGGFGCVVDAIDHPASKALLIVACRRRGIPVIACGGAAGRRDPTAIRAGDLSEASNDPLLREVRRVLRAQHGYPPGGHPFGIDCVWSHERQVFAWPDGSARSERDPAFFPRPDCKHGMGTAVFVTGALGFNAAGLVVRRLAAGSGDSNLRS